MKLPAISAILSARSTFYRRLRPSTGSAAPSDACPGLSEKERDRVFDTLCSRFVDRSPAEVVATLLDGCLPVQPPRSGLCRFRNAERSGAIPNTLIHEPNQVWSWILTRLGAEEWSYLPLRSWTSATSWAGRWRTGKTRFGRAADPAELPDMASSRRS